MEVCPNDLNVFFDFTKKVKVISAKEGEDDNPAPGVCLSLGLWWLVSIRKKVSEVTLWNATQLEEMFVCLFLSQVRIVAEDRRAAHVEPDNMWTVRTQRRPDRTRLHMFCSWVNATLREQHFKKAKILLFLRSSLAGLRSVLIYLQRKFLEETIQKESSWDRGTSLVSSLMGFTRCADPASATNRLTLGI